MKEIELQKGIGVVEIIIVVFIASIALFSLAQITSFSFKGFRAQEDLLEASFLTEEAIEAVRAVRGEGWVNISTIDHNLEYHPEKAATSSRWILVTGAENIGIFTRIITFEDVFRDANFDITSSGGAIDTDTLKITAKVTYNSGNQSKDVTLVTYLTNFLNN